MRNTIRSSREQTSLLQLEDQLMDRPFPTLSSRVSQSSLLGGLEPAQVPGEFGGLPSLRDSRIWQGYIHFSHPLCSYQAERQHAGICLQSVDLLAGICGKPNHSPLSHHASVTVNEESGDTPNLCSVIEDFGSTMWHLRRTHLVF